MGSWFVRFGHSVLLGTVLLGAAAVVAACSGSGGSARSIPRTTSTAAPTAAPTATPTATASPTASPTVAPAGAGAVLVLSVPCDALTQTTARSRAPQQRLRGARPPAAASSYSPASFALSEQGGGTAVGAIGAPASPCTSSSAVPAYSVSLSSAPGTYTFTISTYASSNGTGTPLSSAYVVATVPAASSTTLHAALATPVASISVTAAPNTLELGSIATVNVVVNAIDTAGNVIVGPGTYKNAAGGNVTIVLSDSDTSGNTKLSTTSVTQPGTAVTLSYNGGYAVTSAKITGTASGVAPSSATVQFACAGAPSTSDLYALGFNDASNDFPTQVDRFPKTVSGFNPTPAGMLAISSQGSDGVEAVTFVVDSNGLISLLGFQPENGTTFIATYCPGSDGSLPAYRLFAPTVLAAPDSGNHLALDASHNFYTTSAFVNVFQGQTSAPLPGLDEYPAGAGAPGVPGSAATSVSPSRAIIGTSTEMVTPVGVAIDAAGAAYVGDQAQINVFGSTQSGNVAPQRKIVNTAGGLIGALDAAYDAAGNLYVLYGADNRSVTTQAKPYGDLAVAEFPPGATTPSRVISGPATSLGTYFGQSQPSQLGPTTQIFAALAVAPDGTIFVASFGSGKSPTTKATTGTEIAVFGAAANGNVVPDRTIDVTALANPKGLGVFPAQLAADAHDTVYIGDDANESANSANGVYAFNTSGALVAHVAASASGLGLVSGLALDASGDLVVQSISLGSQGQTALFVYSTSGGLSGPTKTIPNAAAVPGFAGNRIGVNAAGDVYELSGPALSTSATEVLEFSLNGTSGSPIGGFSDPQTAFQEPSSVAVDPTGRIGIPVIDANTVYVYAASASGSNVSPVASYSDYGPSTLNVRGLAFGSDGATLYATSCDTNSVSVYANGASSASRSIVGALTKLACPFAVALDSSGTVYVADMNGISVFAAGASGAVAPIRETRFEQNQQSNGFAVYDVAIGPGPIGAGTASAARRAAAPAASHPSVERASGRGRRASSARRTASAVCALDERERRAAMAKLLPPGQPIPPARYVSPLCRRR